MAVCRFRTIGVVVILGVLLSAAAVDAETELNVQLFEVETGFNRPVFVTHAGDGSGRLFVVEQRGRIRIIDPNLGLLPQDFLHLGPVAEGGIDLVSQTGGEQGLLGLAFHPDYPLNGKFYVCYTSRRDRGAGLGSSIISEFHVSEEDPNIADTTEKIILGPIEQPGTQHNGGMLAFGPDDDYLYIGLGDGDGIEDSPTRDDLIGNAQDTSNLLGSILRIDVDIITSPTMCYAIPPTNPFVSGPLVGMGSPEIFAWGFQNPWRFSFDRNFPFRLLCGDVGRLDQEEIDLVENGLNYGWKIMEANICTPPNAGCNMTGLTLPIFAYDHVQANQAVVGGYVYRGSDYPALRGLYFFADYNSGRIWTLPRNSDGTWGPRTEHENIDFISSFGEDERGELYVIEYDQGISGTVYQIFDGDVGTPTPRPTLTATFTTTPVGGGSTSTPTFTATVTPTPTITRTRTNTGTPGPSQTPTMTSIPGAATSTPTRTSAPTKPPTPTVSGAPTATFSATPVPWDLVIDGTIDSKDILEFLRQNRGAPVPSGAQPADQGDPPGIDPLDLLRVALRWKS